LGVGSAGDFEQGPGSIDICVNLSCGMVCIAGRSSMDNGVWLDFVEQGLHIGFGSYIGMMVRETFIAIARRSIFWVTADNGNGSGGVIEQLLDDVAPEKAAAARNKHARLGRSHTEY